MQGIVVEVIFSVGQILVALIINKIGKFPITCELTRTLFFAIVKIIQHFVLEIVFIFIVCGFGGILAMLTDIPIVQVYAFTALMSCGLGMNVVNSVAVELFPTSLR